MLQAQANHLIEPFEPMLQAQANHLIEPFGQASPSTSST
jgi:hypothetical protein